MYMSSVIELEGYTLFICYAMTEDTPIYTVMFQASFMKSDALSAIYTSACVCPDGISGYASINYHSTAKREKGTLNKYKCISNSNTCDTLDFPTKRHNTGALTTCSSGATLCCTMCPLLFKSTRSRASVIELCQAGCQTTAKTYSPAAADNGCEK